MAGFQHTLHLLASFYSTLVLPKSCLCWKSLMMFISNQVFPNCLYCLYLEEFYKGAICGCLQAGVKSTCIEEKCLWCLNQLGGSCFLLKYIVSCTWMKPWKAVCKLLPFRVSEEIVLIVMEEYFIETPPWCCIDEF